MSDMMQGAMQWLREQRKEHMSHPVLYRRGNSSVELAATTGRTVFRIDEGYGRYVRSVSRDFLFHAGDLVIDGLVTEPEAGDAIIDAGFVYELMAPGGEPVWRFADSCDQTVRAHTKFMGKDE